MLLFGTALMWGFMLRVISFHSLVRAARDFANKLPEGIDWMPQGSRPDDELLTGHVSGVMPTHEKVETFIV